MDAEQLRKKFIDDNAVMLLEELQMVLRGEGEFSSESGIWLGYAFERLSKMVDSADDLRVMDAENTKQVLEALSKGRITMAQAKELMELLKMQKEADGTLNNPKLGQATAFILHKDYVPTPEEDK